MNAPENSGCYLERQEEELSARRQSGYFGER